MKKLKKKIIKFVKDNQTEVIILSLILLVGAFLRFYRLPEYMTFLGDEGRDALVWLRMIRNGKFVLIGPMTSIGNMYLGPLYYYFALPWFFLFGLSPIGPSAMVAFLGVVTIGFVWWVGCEWFNQQAGLIAALLLIPTVGLFWLLTLKDVLKNKDKIKSLILYTLVCVLIFGVLTILPLVWFDLRHQFINFQAFKAFFTVRQTTVNLKVYKAIPQIWNLASQVWTRLIAVRNEAYGGWLVILTILGLVGFSFNRYYKRPKWSKIWQENKPLILILVWLIVGLFGLGNYKQHIYDHYFGFFFPAPFLLVGWVLSQTWQKKIYGKVIFFVILAFLISLACQNNLLKRASNNT